MAEKKKVVALLNDLMFTVKIQEAAKRAGLEPVFVKSQQDAIERAKENPAIIILDLNHSAADPLGTISMLKNNSSTNGITLLAYVSHVQTGLRQAAQDKGCDIVVARSALSQNLPDILMRYAA